MITNINTEQLKEWLHDSEAILVDVRELVEFQSGTIDGALHIPLSEIAIKFPLIPKKESSKIILFCAAGVRSLYACQILQNDGYEGKLYNYQPGYSTWKS